MSDPSTAQAPLPAPRTITLTFTEGQADAIMDGLPLGHSVNEAIRDLFIRLREARRQPAQEGPMSYIPEDHDDGVFHAPPQPVRPIPQQQPSRGLIMRKADPTGISGVGCIAQFCVFSDGGTAIRWLGGPPQDEPKFEVYDRPGIGPFVKISGHNGNTEIVWIDEPAPQQ